MSVVLGAVDQTADFGFPLSLQFRYSAPKGFDDFGLLGWQENLQMRITYITKTPAGARLTVTSASARGAFGFPD